VYIEGHELYTLRSGNVLNYVCLMELEEDHSYYVAYKSEEGP